MISKAGSVDYGIGLPRVLHLPREFSGKHAAGVIKAFSKKKY
jgi:hypothetical protein